ncbi:hypothetical protein [Nocardioides gilvus]|uniref:hypothetical protein n=1 Tax=Nocardioides gilvus TaxID=1735589 RepID=UPI000D74CD76|nr:hypothetical protein [Nocardioides gilvus]
MTLAWLSLALLVTALVTSLVGWRVRGSRLTAALVLLATAAASALLWRLEDRTLPETVTVPLLLVTAVLAVAGGGPLTTATFALVDGSGAPASGSVRRAADVLRGGAWIGALERTSIFVALLLGWPEGLALTLALKGLGRYPELRHQDRPGIAERFLIGTFVSVLWACACAGVVALALA